MRANTSKSIAATLLCMVCVVSFSGCSDSDGGTDADVDVDVDADAANDDLSTDTLVTRIGVVHINDSPARMHGVFFKTSGPISAQSYIDQLIEVSINAADDTCVIDADAPEPENPFFPTLTGPNQNEITQVSISAGEVLTIASETGTFSELPSSTESELISYYWQGIEDPLLPDSLILDVPGDEFPAFAGVEIPDIQTLVPTSHTANEEISVADEITWLASTSDDDVISLYTFTTFSSNAETIGEESEIAAGTEVEKRLVIDCILIDDGSFTFSEEQQAGIAESGLTEVSISLGRLAPVKIVEQDDAALILLRGSGDF